MDPTPLIETGREMRGHFIKLLDILSGLRSLTSLDLKQRTTHQLLEDALKTLLRHHDLERTSVYLVEGDRLVWSAGTDYQRVLDEDIGEVVPELDLPRVSVAMGEGLVGTAAASRTLQSCADCRLDHHYIPVVATGENAGGATLSAPVLNGDTVLGVVNIYHPDRGHFQEWHRQGLLLFCDVLAYMLASHQVVRRLEEAVARRTAELESALAEAERLKRRYEELSTVDELTQLHNRRFFFPETEALMARAVRHAQPLCLLALDLDFFKRVNDNYGHEVGDQVLQGVAEILRRHTREGDILARFGGEEFFLALPSTSASGAATLAERIRQRIHEEAFDARGRRFRVSASIGVACHGQDDPGQGTVRERLERLIRRADRALYYCKDHGRDQVAVYQDIAGGDKDRIID